VLLVPGPLALDRDRPFQNLPGADLYRHLAAHLAHAGIASLRFDARGRGESGGQQEAASLAQLTEDAAAALTSLSAIPEVDGGAIYLLSHGISSLVALPLLSGEVGVRGYLALAPTLREIWEVLIYGRTAPLVASGISVKLIEGYREHYDELIDQLKAGTYPDEELFGLPVALWDELLAYDGAPALLAFDGAVLAMRGDQDLVIPREQLEAFAEVAGQRPQGTVTTHTLEGISFTFAEGTTADLWEAAHLPLEIPAATLEPLLDWLTLDLER
jgi:alpha-beta hydrolase superfamily lysophospholipase